ncbi:MAG: flagellar basal body-associated FliL family protein [Kiloniellaceae bacterium]
MTDQAASEDTDTGAAAEVEVEARPGGRFSGKKLVLFVMLPALLLAMTAAGVYFSGLADSLLGSGEDNELLAEVPEGPSVFYDLPEMLVNLNSSGRRTGYLKLAISLELASEEDVDHLEEVLPRVIDNFQVYLRELRIEDLRGSAGLQRLREELLLRVASAARPTVIKDVLFKELLVQ